MNQQKIFWVIFSLLVGGSLVAEDYTITRTMFIPAVYYVGDAVEMRMSLRTAFAKKLTIPKEIAQPLWGAVSNVRLIEREDEPELRLTFTSYIAGTRTLPSINLGSVVLEGINVYVTSLLPTGPEAVSPSGSREQVFIPYTFLKIILQVIIVLLVPVGLFFATIVIRRFLHRFFWGRRDHLPWRRIQRSLHNMVQTIESFDARGFYIRLLDETRLYLSDRLRISAFSATSSELEKNLQEHVHHQETVHSLIALFRHGDRVKFAGEPASIQSRMKDIQMLEKVLSHIEHEEHFRRMAENDQEIKEQRTKKGHTHVDA